MICLWAIYANAVLYTASNRNIEHWNSHDSQEQYLNMVMSELGSHPRCCRSDPLPPSDLECPATFLFGAMNLPSRGLILDIVRWQCTRHCTKLYISFIPLLHKWGSNYDEIPSVKCQVSANQLLKLQDMKLSWWNRPIATTYRVVWSIVLIHNINIYYSHQ